MMELCRGYTLQTTMVHVCVLVCEKEREAMCNAYVRESETENIFFIRPLHSSCVTARLAIETHVHASAQDKCGRGSERVCHSGAGRVRQMNTVARFVDTPVPEKQVKASFR